MAKIIPLNNITCLDIPSERVIEGILKHNLKSVVVMGYDEHGEEYFASSMSDGGDVLWLLARCKQRLMGIE